MTYEHLAHELRNRLLNKDLADPSKPGIADAMADDDIMIASYITCSDCGTREVDEVTLTHTIAAARSVDHWFQILNTFHTGHAVNNTESEDQDGDDSVSKVPFWSDKSRMGYLLAGRLTMDVITAFPHVPTGVLDQIIRSGHKTLVGMNTEVVAHYRRGHVSAADTVAYVGSNIAVCIAGRLVLSEIVDEPANQDISGNQEDLDALIKLLVEAEVLIDTNAFLSAVEKLTFKMLTRPIIWQGVLQVAMAITQGRQLSLEKVLYILQFSGVDVEWSVQQWEKAIRKVCTRSLL